MEARKVLGDIMADIIVLLISAQEGVFQFYFISFDLVLQMSSNQFQKFSKNLRNNLGQ
jgi:hypothetical protein